MEIGFSDKFLIRQTHDLTEAKRALEKTIESMQTKDSNPKDAIAANKLPLSLVPSTLIEYASLAFLEGALKYGRFNWRVKGVRVSVYIDALTRHVNKYVNGQWADPKTNVPHLASAIACLGIILDANQMGMLTDDRPPSLPNHDKWVDDQAGPVEHLKRLFVNHTPHQYTIRDSKGTSNG